MLVCEVKVRANHGAKVLCLDLAQIGVLFRIHLPPLVPKHVAVLYVIARVLLL